MTLESLLEHPELWRAGRPGGGGASHRPVQPSLYPILDRFLPGGGWPIGAVSELCFQQTGIGELQLLVPALSALSQRQRWVAWVNPPFLPYPPALAASGIRLGRMLLIRRPAVPEQPSSQQEETRHRQMLWALEQATRSGACSAVLAWLDERRITPRHIQRLQVAARQGNTLLWLFRPDSVLQQASLASLRLRLHAVNTGSCTGVTRRLRVDIIKRHGGWPVEGLTLDLQDAHHHAAHQINERMSINRASVMELLGFWRSERADTHLIAPVPATVATPMHTRALH
jgi:cell division inhibitor SulA